MSGLVCDCPLPAAINDIPVDACKFSFDQIQKFFFQRKQASAPFTALAPITALANVTPFLSAVDGTKIGVSPFVSNVVIPQSEALENGGNDNTTLSGIPEYNGEGNQLLSGIIKNASASTIAALRTLTCESLGELGIDVFTAYFVTRNGDIIAKGTDPAGNIEGISVYNIRVGSLGSEGFNAKNQNAFSFYLLPGWDEEFIQIKRSALDYDPLALTN